MQPRACLFSAFSIFIIAGTVTAAAAEMDVSKCGTAYKQWQDAFNQGDTSTVAALYASDAVEAVSGAARPQLKIASTKPSRKGGRRTW